MMTRKPSDSAWVNTTPTVGPSIRPIPPATTITTADHQGGGMGRISRWDGSKFAPVTDWCSANQDAVWAEIKKYSSEFAKTGK